MSFPWILGRELKVLLRLWPGRRVWQEVPRKDSSLGSLDVFSHLLCPQEQRHPAAPNMFLESRPQAALRLEATPARQGPPRGPCSLTELGRGTRRWSILACPAAAKGEPLHLGAPRPTLLSSGNWPSMGPHRAPADVSNTPSEPRLQTESLDGRTNTPNPRALWKPVYIGGRVPGGTCKHLSWAGNQAPLTKGNRHKCCSFLFSTLAAYACTEDREIKYI